MSVPDFQKIMLPLLKILGDKKEHHLKDITEILSKIFNLTDNDRKELLPSGKQPIFNNRVGWAQTYLKKAGLIDSPKRTVFVITDLGINVLNQNQTTININFLNQFSKFKDFHTAKKEDNTASEAINNNEEQTPEEIIETTYTQLRESLAYDLLEKVLNQSPYFFENLVIELLVKMGYGGSIKEAGSATKKSGDEGIDGIIKEDKLGLDVIYIQAKKWKKDSTVGRPDIQRFVGALAGQGAKKGIFITTSCFSKEAREYTTRNETKIVLIDGEQLCNLMIDYNIGVATSQLFELKKLDNDYFEGE